MNVAAEKREWFHEKIMTAIWKIRKYFHQGSRCKGAYASPFSCGDCWKYAGLHTAIAQEAVDLLEGFYNRWRRDWDYKFDAMRIEWESVYRPRLQVLTNVLARQLSKYEDLYDGISDAIHIIDAEFV